MSKKKKYVKNMTTYVGIKEYLLCLFFSFLLCTSTISFALTGTTRSFAVDSLGSHLLVYNLDEESIFTGSISISGGSDNDIKFWVTDPEGLTVINLGTVSQGCSFKFTTEKTGGYTLHFDNSFSSNSSKIVTLSYNIETAKDIGSNPYFLSGLCFGVAIVAVAMMYYFIYKKKPKTNLNPPQPA